MSLGDTIQTELHVRRVFSICGIMVFCQFGTFLSAYVYSSYLGRSTFDSAFLFRASDLSSIADGFTELQHVGRHTFGDFAWVFSLTKMEGWGGYFGASQVFLLVATQFPMLVSLFAMFGLSVAIVWVAIRLVMPTEQATTRLLVITAMFFGVQPVLLAFDRGQIHVLMIALLILGCSFLSRESKPKYSVAAAIVLGTAVSMKLAPIFFLLIFVRRRSWRLVKIAIVSLFCSSVAPMIIGPLGIGSYLETFGIRSRGTNQGMKSLYGSDEYFIQSRAYNHSFKALIDLTVQHVDWLRPFAIRLVDNYTIVAAIFCVVLGLLITSRHVSLVEALTLCAIGTCRLLPIAAGYTTAVFLAPLFWIIGQDHEEPRSRGQSMLILFLSVSTMSFQIPLGGGSFTDTTYTLNSLTGPLLSVILLVGLSIRTVCRIVRQLIP